MQTASRSHPYLLQNYNRAPVTFVRGEGCELIDENGERYLDLVAGIAVCSLGHAHPEITKAVADQAATLVHCSNLYSHEPAGKLATALASRAGLSRVFFCNSGAEANEAAIKLARKYAYRRGERERTTILSCTGSFHGRTMGALTATANNHYHEGFEPLPGGFRYTQFNDLEALERDLTSDVCAVLIEPVQGESGVFAATHEYLERARQLCDERGALLIFDEIQCGCGRLGKFFAFETLEVRPDIVTLAKALANGLPIGAMLMKERCADVLKPGDHGTTFGGSPVPCAAALAHLRIRDELNLDAHVREVGDHLRAGLLRFHHEAPEYFHEPRGSGLMLGPPVSDALAASAIASAALERKLLVNAAGANTLRFVPPLIISAAQIDEAMERLRSAVHSLTRSAKTDRRAAP